MIVCYQCNEHLRIINLGFVLKKVFISINSGVIMQIGIRKKINFLLFLSMLAVGLSIGLTFYFRYSDYMMKSVVDKLYNGLFSIYNIVDMDELPTLDRDGYKTPEYIKNWNKIRNIQKELNLAYVYLVLMNKKNQFYFLYDTGDDPEITDKEDDYFTIYNDAPPEAYECFKTGKMVVVKGQYTDRWGTFKSAFYPIRIDGKIVGVIGADYNISDILELKKQALITLFSILLVGVFVVILVGMVIKRLIVNPIIQLNEGAREIANGNLDYSIALKQKDEIGELAKCFNTMAQNLKTSFATIKEHNEQLEEKVALRTEELQQTLNTVQELKVQQDGDYFLTTLITNPLMQNRNKSSFVKIEFFTEQKKKFQFKGKTHNLGGDISIAGNLNFLGKQYTMFFNGDAMGKSMQGAGGALVIGSVVNSIMARSAANKKVITKDPERWLKETFAEIQNVMEAFDGSMLVSCILGIIEDETGILQFFNAEHPLSVLYRDGKANFIEDEITAHKLGMPFNSQVGLIRFQLQPNDVIFCGSDGKDDLILERIENGGRIVNEDENLFLQVVEESRGELKKIYNKLAEKGEFSDDLSIVRISFKEEKSELTYVSENTLTKIDFVAELMKEKRFSEAYDVLKEEADENNIVNLYRRAYCLNKLHMNSEAIELLEQADRQIKQHTKILKLLAKMYYEMGKLEDAKVYTDKLLELSPEDAQALLLKERLSSRS